LEIGRNEEILINHLNQDPQLLCRKLPPLLPITDIRNPFDFSFGKEIDIGSLRIPNDTLAEKVVIDNRTLSFIASTLKLAAAGLAEGEKLLSQDFCRSEHLRLEEPLMRDGFVLPKPKNDIRDFEPLPVREENDEGLKWSAVVQSNVRRFEKKFQSEKLDMPVELRDFLKKCCEKPKQIDFDDVLHSEVRIFPSSAVVCLTLLAHQQPSAHPRATQPASACAFSSRSPGSTDTRFGEPWCRASPYRVQCRSRECHDRKNDG